MLPTTLAAFLVLIIVYLIGIAIGVWYFVYGAKEEVASK